MFRSAAALLCLAMLTAACGGGGQGGQAEEWPRRGEHTPVLVSSEVATGKNRFLLSLLNADGTVAASPDLPVTLTFYDLDRSTADAEFQAETTFAYTIPGARGVYIAHPDFDRAGRWGVEIDTAGQPRLVFTVKDETIAPSPGRPAPPSRTPTADDVGGDLTRISTDSEPDPALYEMSIDEALAAGEPFVVVFATPTFCKSAVCGPTLDRVKDAVAGLAAIRVIHVEVVDPEDPLDDAGNIKPVPAVFEWQLPTEPWVFVVDGDGTITAAFEGFVTEEELRDAVAAVGR